MRFYLLLAILPLLISSKSTTSSLNSEVHVDVLSNESALFIKGLKLASYTSDAESIYFFDTSNLTLYNDGLIFRARIEPGTNGNVMAKLRPCNQSLVPSSVSSASGYKVNYDLMETQNVLDCTISQTVTNALIKSVAKGTASIKSLFNANQLALAKVADSSINYSSLEVLGPIAATSYSSINLTGLNYGSAISATIWNWDNEVVSLELQVTVAESAASTTQTQINSYM